MAAQRPGQDTMEDYYLAERKLSWWALSLADLSSYIDIAGTMINTALVYALGLQQAIISLNESDTSASTSPSHNQ